MGVNDAREQLEAAKDYAESLEAAVAELRADLTEAEADLQAEKARHRITRGEYTELEADYQAVFARSALEFDPLPTITVSYYEHDCEWGSKYCDEHHRHFVSIPASVLARLVPGVSDE